MVLDASLLNTQHYKVRIKGKVEQSRERSSTLLYLSAVPIEKGAFGSPSTTIANFTFYNFCLHTVQTVLFQTVHFRISIQFSSIWPIDRTLSGATTPGKSGPGVLRIPQSITGASPLDFLVSYPGHLLFCREAVGVFYNSSPLVTDMSL